MEVIQFLVIAGTLSCFYCILVNWLFLFISIAIVSFLVTRHMLSVVLQAETNSQWTVIWATTRRILGTSLELVGQARDVMRRLFYPNHSVTHPKPLFCGAKATFDNELITLVDHIVDDYIVVWYSVISPTNDEFVDDCRIIIRHIFRELINRCINRVDSTKFYLQATELVMETLKDPSADHSLKENEADFVARVVEDLLTLVAPRELNVLKSTKCTEKQMRDGLRIFLKELLTKAVFIPIVSYVCNPDWLNRVIVELLQAQAEVSMTRSAALESREREVAASFTERQLSITDTPRRASSASLDRAKPRPLQASPLTDIRRSHSADVYPLILAPRKSKLHAIS